MIIIDVEQGSDEWLKARAGRVTASRIADMLTRTKSGYSASRKNYAAQLITERLTGEPSASFTNAAMQWGTDHEPDARNRYQFMTDNEVATVGLVQHSSIIGALASPDGLVGDDGLVEIKCPNTATHIETLIKEKIDGRYIQQMQWQMACTGYAWCDFVSFDPRLPAEMQVFQARVERDDEMIADMESEVEMFLEEISDTVRKLKDKYPAPEMEAAA